jgi:hypothetical protein
MTDGRLAQTQRCREVADARLGTLCVRDQAQEPKTGGICDHSECCRHLLGLSRAERGRENLRAALLRDDLDEFHADILTMVDASVNISTPVDEPRGGVPRERRLLPRGLLPGGLLLEPSGEAGVATGWTPRLAAPIEEENHVRGERSRRACGSSRRPRRAFPLGSWVRLPMAVSMSIGVGRLRPFGLPAGGRSGGKPTDALLGRNAPTGRSQSYASPARFASYSVSGFAMPLSWKAPTSVRRNPLGVMWRRTSSPTKT